MNRLFNFLRVRPPVALSEGPAKFVYRYTSADPSSGPEQMPRREPEAAEAAEDVEPVVEALAVILDRVRKAPDLDGAQLRAWVDEVLGDDDSFRSRLGGLHAAAAGGETGSAHHTAEAVRLLATYDAAGEDATDTAAWRWMLDAPVPVARRGSSQTPWVPLVPERDEPAQAAPPEAAPPPSPLERYRQVVAELAGPGRPAIQEFEPREPPAGKPTVGDPLGPASAHAALLAEATALWGATQAPLPRRRWLLGNGIKMPLSATTQPAAPVPNGVPLPGLDYLRLAGVGDVYRIEEWTSGYRLGDIAHIENVLPSESFERVHERASEREEILLVEQVVSATEQRDLESTDRFEMQAEFSTASSSSRSFGVSMDVTAGYGPVEGGFAVDSNAQTTLESSRQQASAYAKERVEKVRSSVEQSIRTQRTTRTLDKVLDRSTHAIENTHEGATAVVGIYRWVDRVHGCRLLNHGIRVLLEFYVPQPAALLAGEAVSGKDAVVIEEPPELLVQESTGKRPMRPDDIGEWNYAELAHRFGAIDIEPPPPEFQTVAHAVDLQTVGTVERIMVNGEPSQVYWDDADSVKSEVFALPEGYELMSVLATLGTVKVNSPNAIAAAIDIRVMVANRILRLSSSRIGGVYRWSAFAQFLEDEPPLRLPGPIIPVVIAASHPEPVGVGLHMWCRRTQEHYAAWRLATFVKLMRANVDARREFDRAVEAARSRDRSFGTDVGTNRALERRELKRGCIATLVRENFEGFGTLVTDTDGFPYPGRQDEQPPGRVPVTTQRALVLAAEEMIDWENMTYTLYPYYWADRSAWSNLIAATSDDPLHQNFLSAGAARVVVPLQVGPHESVMLYSMLSRAKGKPLDLDALTDTEFAYIDELRRRPAEGAEPTVEDEWEVRLPTSLVYLDREASIPLTIDDVHPG